ncbi:MAG: Kef family K(+) transporter [Hyphomicrobium sp. 32-62-53]|nr:MAG: Kef family K(+) transporter [Hyphomicrobium sp. 12-62-95]OYX98516.1 MAG: Kef family K(+) transporter [Hyphomicrobium sp. 32-62-53]
MPHDTPLIATIVVGLSLAFVLGTIAQRLRISPIVGYLLAGVAVGPFTPGFVADQGLATELAEIGVILLMFGVGLHFSLSDLLSVKAIAVPGAVVQIVFATVLGAGLAHIFGWPLGAGLVFGLALSVASTVVLLRALQERHLVTTEQGRIAVGWLIVEDLVMVLALVALPALAPLLAPEGTNGVTSTSEIALTLGITVLKVIAFFAVMMLVGRRVIPWILHYIAHTGSRELFRLGVLTIALGVAFGAAKLFGVSFALGAFFAGMILSESPLSQQAANESLPLRDAFAVLFFVSVGMLFNPIALVDNTGAILATVAIIVLGKSLAALAIVMAFGHPLRTGLLIAASLAQIGEFSFILAGLGVTLNILPEEGRELILAGAIVSIVLNPLLFHLLDRYGPPAKASTDTPTDQRAPDDHTPDYITGKTNHTVLVGYGRVGKIVGQELIDRGEPLVIIDDRDDAVTKLREQGVDAIATNAVKGLSAANIGQARTLILAIPDCFEAGQIVEQARNANPALTIIAGAMTDAEETYLKNYGATTVVQGSRETANAILAALSPARPGA